MSSKDTAPKKQRMWRPILSTMANRLDIVPPACSRKRAPRMKVKMLAVTNEEDTGADRQS
jgi:hypothetical protein